MVNVSHSSVVSARVADGASYLCSDSLSSGPKIYRCRLSINLLCYECVQIWRCHCVYVCICIVLLLCLSFIQASSLTLWLSGSTMHACAHALCLLTRVRVFKDRVRASLLCGFVCESEHMIINALQSFS